MTKDDDFIDYEVPSEDRPYYLDIDGKRIYVTEEVYRAYKQPFWAEHKRKERERRCQVSNGSGGVKRCMEDCSICSKSKTGKSLSLDKLYADYEYEISDQADGVLEEMVKDELYQKQLEFISTLDIIDQQIVRLLIERKSEREIAKIVGLSQKAINKRKTKFQAQAEEKLKKYR